MPTVPERDLHDVVRRILMVKWYSVPQSTLAWKALRTKGPALFDAQERMAYDTFVAGIVYSRRAPTREPL